MSSQWQSGKKGEVSSSFLSQLPSPCLGMNLLPCEWSWCLARSRQKKKPTPGRFSSNLWILQKIKTLGTFPSPAFPLCFAPAHFSPAGWGTGVDAHGDAKHDPRVLLGLGLSRAGFQEGRSPSQAVVDDRSDAFRSGSQRGR